MMLGQVVRCSATLARRTDSRSYSSWTKVWSRVPLNQPVEGVLIGLRTLYDGTAYYNGPEDGIDWRHTKAHRVALVAVDLRRKHILVPVDALDAEAHDVR